MPTTMNQVEFSPDEIKTFRKETPGCTEKIHLNNAGAGLMPVPVIIAIQEHISLEAKIGGYEAADKKNREICQFYQAAATLLNCKPSNLAFTANATDSFSRALSSIPFRKGDTILTSNEDYISNQINYLSFVKRFGLNLVRVSSLPTGGIDLEDLERKMKALHPKLVAITHIPTNSGLIQPVEFIGDIVRRFDSLYLVDACQSVGQLPLDVEKIQCDFLSATSRKFLRGPRGAGFLYISDKALDAGLEPLFIDMRGAEWVQENKYVPRKDAMRFEDWEFAYALLLGTTSAIKYAMDIGIDRIRNQVTYLTDYLIAQLRTISEIRVLDKGESIGGIVTIAFNGKRDAASCKEYFAQHNINIVLSFRNFAVIDFDEKGVEWAIRISPHYYNTIREIDVFVKSLRSLIYNATLP
jgi:selenocysteine lyase/cysteine desulfurase